MGKAEARPDLAAILGVDRPETVSEAELADTLGLSTRSIRELVTRNVIRKAAPGRYVQRDCVRAYCANLREGAAARSGSATLTAERTRVAREQGDALELKNAVSRREMLPARDVERSWSATLRAVRAAMLSVPARIQQRLPKLSAQEVATIDREIRDTLEEAANGDI